MAKTNAKQKNKAQPDVTPDKMRIEYMELGVLKRWPRNPKGHDEEAIGESMRENGFAGALELDEGTGRMVGGHGRLTQLEKMWEAGEPAPERIMVKGGKWYVPVIRGVKFKNEAAAERYLLAANRLVELGGWDNGLLSSMLARYKEEDKLLGTGFDSGDVVRFLALVKGDKVGLNTDQRKEVFDNMTIKQIVLYFPSAQFEVVIKKLDKILQERKDLNSHSAIFLEMLNQWEGGKKGKKRK